MAQLDCIVVGAGPVGLVTALRLARAGHRVQVLEAEPCLSRALRASTFHPPTLDMLATLGVTHELLPRGVRVPVWHIRQHPSGEHIAFDLSRIADDTSHPFRLQCEQHVLCELLLAALEEESTAEITFSARVDDVQQDADGVTARFEGDGASSSLRGSWLVGADGAGSTVRHSVGLGFAGKTWEDASLLVTTAFPFEDHIDDLAGVTYFWGRHRPFSLLRIPGRWRASLYPGAGQDLEALAADAAVHRALEDIVPGQPIDVQAVHPYRVHARCAESFRRGRVLLAGDAAHLNPPSGGMGMNGGIHDAFDLTDELIHVLRGAHDERLDRYDRRRRTLASESIIPLASANRSRMHLTGAREQRRVLRELRRIVNDEAKGREYLLRASMIAGLRRAESLA